MPATVRLRLPEAPARSYLEWMTFWREVERRMLERPSLAARAAEEAAPFVRDPLADWLSEAVVTEIVRQASEAVRAGTPTVSPELTVERDRILAGVDYVIRRARWLDEDRVQEAMRIEPLAPHLRDLRRRVLEAIRAQLERN